jgi:UDP-2,3-diacylglucosamine pyrophosphatase LpxH
MVILAVSDIHIGCKDSQTNEFKAFLNYVKTKDVEHFMIVGDFVDMWRRDVSGLFLENYDILQSLKEMENNHVNVHYIVGNHDIHLLKLKNHQYPFEFKDLVPLKVDGATFIFKHGYDFEILQRPQICELLCHNFSDKAGDFRSEFWKWITSRPDISKTIEEAIKATAPITSKVELDTESKKAAYFDYLMAPPSKRMPDELVTEEKIAVSAEMTLPFRSVEKNAAASVKKGEILVFGHTHRPFVNDDRRLANAGSWMGNETICNTYIEIDGKDIRLMQFDGTKGEDITPYHLRNYKVN